MDAFLTLGKPGFLTRHVLWLYRVFRARGLAAAYFPAAFTAWRTAIAEHLPGAEAAPLLALYGNLVERQEEFSQQEGADRALEPMAAPELDALVAAFLAGDLPGADALIGTLQASGGDLEEFYLQILTPVLHEIGRRWEQARVSPAEEHIASALATRMMVRAYERLDARPEPGKRAVVCTAPREEHQIGAWMVSDLLELKGWDARLLGVDTAPGQLLEVLAAFRPQVLAISITLSFHLQEVAGLIATVRAHPGLEGLRIMVGGQAFHGDPSLFARLKADGYVADAHGAVLLAERWWAEAKP